jgi:hypothetical protein
MILPDSRGTLTARLFTALRSDDPRALPRRRDVPVVGDCIAHDDIQLALWTCYELHYRGFDDVSAEWEWHPDLVGLCHTLEDQFVAHLRREVHVPAGVGAVTDRLWSLVQNDTGASPSKYLQAKATREEFCEYATHRSIYQLKEADPHTWGIPRLSGRAKAALVEIQMDEYGNGDLDQMHARLFARVLRFLDLDDTYGAHIDVVPAITLALSNVISLFGLHREYRGALAGHLAAFELTSSLPSRRISQGLRRLGAGDEACAFHDVHVVADSMHEQVALHDLCGGLASDEPHLTEDIIFGAAACLYIDARFAEHVLGRWAEGSSSLRQRDAHARSARWPISMVR